MTVGNNNFKPLSFDNVIIKETFLRELANALVAIIADGRFADSVLQKKLREHKWLPEERSLFAQATYDILRNWRRVWFAIGQEPSPEMPRVIKAVCAWFAMNGFKLQRSASLPDIDVATVRSKWQQAEGERAIKYSLPDWLDKRGAKELGEVWNQTVHALHHEPVVALRVNTIKATRTDVQQQLKALGIQTNTTALAPDALILREHTNIFGTEVFKKGFVEMQDVGSQCIAPFVQPEPGMRVIDACAGSGGKSIHLAALMCNKGKIIALDTEEWKLTDLSKRAQRNGIHIIETRHINTTKVIKRLTNSVERVLLDVPCSGLGVLRRNPDAKWHLQPEDINSFITIQRDILTRYSAMITESGKLVYATCSVLPSEGEEQVRWFIQQNPTWRIEEERRINPHTDNCDSFYMARLSKQ
ncbi:MAG: RNA methyltransferase [Candidatus Kapaibacterium sp.]